MTFEADNLTNIFETDSNFVYRRVFYVCANRQSRLLFSYGNQKIFRVKNNFCTDHIIRRVLFRQFHFSSECHINRKQTQKVVRV